MPGQPKGPWPPRCPELRMMRNGRTRNTIPETTTYRENIPLALKNRVKMVPANRNQEKSCSAEMMAVIDCFAKFNHDKKMCSKELQTFEQCYKNFRSKLKQAETNAPKGLPVGKNPRMFNGLHMNEYLKRFPQSGRTRQAYIAPEYRE